MSGLIPADAIAIGIGAFLGALSRYQIGRLATEWISQDPNRWGKLSGWHTAGINIGGSFFLGGIAASPVIHSSSSPSKLQSPSTNSLIPRLGPFWFMEDKKFLSTTKANQISSGSSRNLPSMSAWWKEQRILFPQGGLSPRTKLMLGVGFCGSYTTFSTYSVDVVTWFAEGKTTKALSYVAANNIGGIAAAAAGMMLMKKFYR